MGSTITEKILARAAGLASVRAGQEITAKPDFVLAYDFPGVTDMFFRQMRDDFGIQKLQEPERFGVFIDHMIPASKPQEEELHKSTRAWCEANGVALFERRGIGHQVASEVGFAVPGGFVVHHDGHISQLGAYGTFAIGIRRRLIEAFVRDKIAITVPSTVRINFRGSLRKGVMARDVFHHLVRIIRADGARDQVLELGGPGLSNFTTEGLQTMTGLAMFTGAVSSIVNPDKERLAYALERARVKIDPVYSDPDADFAAVHDIDLGELGPIVVIPPSPHNTRDLSDFIGLEVHCGYLGSCASGRLEDLRIAAKILGGRSVKPGMSLNIVPTSQEIMAQAAREGLISALAESGAFISSSSCDFCFGHIGTMAAGQRAVSTGTLNVTGRMGSIESEIFLMNAAAVAASAVEGKIADPRAYL